MAWISETFVWFLSYNNFTSFFRDRRQCKNIRCVVFSLVHFRDFKNVRTNANRLFFGSYGRRRGKEEVPTRLWRGEHKRMQMDSEARQMDVVGKYVRLFGGEHLFQGLYNQSCQHLAVFLSFSFVSCFELSEGRHHYPRQPLNEASKEIHSSFIIAMTSSDQHEVYNSPYSE